MDLTCVICLHEIKEFNKKYTLECEHMFHYKCINYYKKFNNTKLYIKCPICKYKTYNKEEEINISLSDIIVLICINNIVFYISIYGMTYIINSLELIIGFLFKN